MNRRPRLLLVAAALVVIAAGCGGSTASKRQRAFDKGNQFFQQGNYQEAAIEYRNAVQTDALFGESHAKLADTYERLGNGRAALNEFVRAADLLPNDVRV